MVAQGSKRMYKRWQVEAASVLRPELGNWYRLTSPVFHIVTELPRFNGKDYRPQYSVEMSKNLWPSLICCSIEEETGEQNAAVSYS